MKFKHLLYAGAALLALSACSKEDADTGNGGNESGEGAYLSLSISLPNAPGTRGINEGDNGTEAGTDDEQKVNSLLVLVYDATGNNIETAKIFTENDLTPAGPNTPPISSNVTAYKTTKPLQVKTSGPKKVVVIVNPGSHFTDKSALADMRKAIENMDQSAVTGIASSTNGFLMTNANTTVNQNEQGQDITTPDGQSQFNLDGSISVNVQGTKTNPTPVTIPVERAVAKITDVSSKYDFVPTNATGDKVVFEKVALVNGNTKFFPIKKIRTSSETNNDYVVDPNFENQSEQTKSDFYFNSFAGNNAIAESDWQTLNSTTPEANRQAFYTLENTMHKDEQKTAYTTGLYYKATYYLNGSTTAENLYKYAGVLYTWSGLETAAPGLGLALGSLSDENSSADEFKAIGVTKYTNGICYYPYWIRHVNNSLPESGVMEFGVVRNNVYKMNIQSVKGIGTPDPVDPDPETPDESNDVMLEVHVQVLPWTIRQNNIDF